jgi:putative oxidoreductase
LSLAGFCVVTALLFHANFTDRTQMFHFLKNFAIVGGLLALYASGPGRMSIDGMNDGPD